MPSKKEGELLTFDTGLRPGPRRLTLGTEMFFKPVSETGGTGSRPHPHLGLWLVLGVAVGMTITNHPPHRSVRAELPHTAPPSDQSVETNVGIRMKSAWARNPSIKDGP